MGDRRKLRRSQRGPTYRSQLAQEMKGITRSIEESMPAHEPVTPPAPTAADFGGAPRPRKRKSARR